VIRIYRQVTCMKGNDNHLIERKKEGLIIFENHIVVIINGVSLKNDEVIYEEVNLRLLHVWRILELQEY